MTVKPMEEYTVRELQEQATKLGMVDAGLLTTKKQLIAIINTLEAKQLVEKETPKVTQQPGLETAVNPAIDNKREDDRRYMSKAMRMKAHLDAQPKVQVFLALEGKEKKGELKKGIVNGKEHLTITGAYETVILNGYRTVIPKGVPFSVPQQVAEILGQSQVATSEAGSQFLVDRSDKVKDALQ
ncbi:MAG: hypothetical protein NUV73_04425 [Candidatus Daviesbacteria bacterium]|nr:hypothetical protein [Candidatus Daviesbacteria bacterium]